MRRVADCAGFCQLANDAVELSIPDVAIAWAQSARGQMEHFAKGYRFTERLPLA
jgi:hypothetical protein